MMLKSLAICIALAVAAPSMAAQTTKAAGRDPRIRFVEYDPYDVLTIYSKVGGDTLIILDKNEQIINMTGGDTESWDLGVSTEKNSVSIKPKTASPDASIHLITNLRHYNIDMKMAKGKQENYLTVIYRYPAQDIVKTAIVSEKMHVDKLLKAGSLSAKNNRYNVQGASSISPVEMYDDGTITYFRFAAHGVVPAVYVVGEDGQEKLANFNGEPDDVLSIHAVSPKFVLRVDKTLVACITNLAYDPIGVRSTTNTISPAVERVLKKEAK